MLKHKTPLGVRMRYFQPPSGGCVLKRQAVAAVVRQVAPAAFRRLCVETPLRTYFHARTNPAAFRRLCVETVHNQFEHYTRLRQPPSGGCVLKLVHHQGNLLKLRQPPSGGCVLKQGFGGVP